MDPKHLPKTAGGRARWAVRESAVILSILLFWLAAGLVILLILGLVDTIVRALGLRALEFVVVLAQSSEVIWAVLTPLATATTALYVLVRAGTILIDHYRAD